MRHDGDLWGLGGRGRNRQWKNVGGADFEMPPPGREHVCLEAMSG
jgi:hypothetical protein